MDKIAVGQLVTFKAEVGSMAASKVISTQYSAALKKQEVVLRDTTGCIKAVLWESDVDVVDVGGTYLFKNFRVKEYRGNRYVNTPKTGEFSVEESLPFQEDLVEIDPDLDSLGSFKVEVKILGIQKATKIL